MISFQFNQWWTRGSKRAFNVEFGALKPLQSKTSNSGAPKTGSRAMPPLDAIILTCSYVQCRHLSKCIISIYYSLSQRNLIWKSVLVTSSIRACNRVVLVQWYLILLVFFVSFAMYLEHIFLFVCKKVNHDRSLKVKLGPLARESFCAGN